MNRIEKLKSIITVLYYKTKIWTDFRVRVRIVKIL